MILLFFQRFPTRLFYFSNIVLYLAHCVCQISVRKYLMGLSHLGRSHYRIPRLFFGILIAAMGLYR